MAEENVVSPPQKPGKRKWRKFGFGFLVQYTTAIPATATPIKLAAITPLALEPRSSFNR